MYDIMAFADTSDDMVEMLKDLVKSAETWLIENQKRIEPINQTTAVSSYVANGKVYTTIVLTFFYRNR